MSGDTRLNNSPRPEVDVDKFNILFVSEGAC